MVYEMIWRVLSMPRFKLTTLPTPIEKAPNLSKDLGVNIFIKRDDVMELAFGGNKVRKLEFILADALRKGADTLITRGAVHSNHARLTAAAAKKAGLEAYLVLTPPGSKDVIQGNLLLDFLLGAKITYVERSEDADAVMEEIADKLRSSGRRPYIIPAGGASEYGVLGYALAALEIVQQTLALNVRPKYIVHTTGTGATQAGLILGLKALGVDDIKVIGISNGRKASEEQIRVLKLIDQASKAFNIEVKVSSDDIIVYDDYIFGGYGVITKEVVEVMKYVARSEGLILDPVYTAKGMYGLIDLIHRGEIKKNEDVIFIHTGGSPITFQYVDKVLQWF